MQNKVKSNNKPENRVTLELYLEELRKYKYTMREEIVLKSRDGLEEFNFENLDFINNDNFKIEQLSLF